MTSTLPDLNIAKTPIYESLVATRGNPYQVDGSAMSTDYGAANDVLGRLLAHGGADGQGWVAVLLVGGPAAAQLSQLLAQGTMAVLPLPGYGYGYGQQPYDPISASMASNMAAGIVRNALQASSPSGFMYDQYAGQSDPYAASALTPAVQANPLDASVSYPVLPQPAMGMSADPAGQYAAMQAQMQVQAQPYGNDQSEWSNAGNAAAHPELQADLPDDGLGSYDPMPTMAFPPGAVPVYPGATYAGMGQPADGRERKESPANGRFGRIASAMRELRGR